VVRNDLAAALQKPLPDGTIRLDSGVKSVLFDEHGAPCTLPCSALVSESGAPCAPPCSALVLEPRVLCLPVPHRRVLPGWAEQVHGSSPARAWVTLSCAARLTRADKATLELFDGTHLPAKVVIGADGVHSRARPRPTRLAPRLLGAACAGRPRARAGQSLHRRLTVSAPAAQVGRALNIPAAEYAGFCAFRRGRPRAGRLCSWGC